MSGSRLLFYDVEEWLDSAIGIVRDSDGANGLEYICECPWCGKYNKLYVNRDTGLYICYACGEAGPFVGLMAEVEGVSFREAAQALRRDAASRLSRSLSAIRDRKRRRADRAALVRGKSRRERAALPQEYIPIWDPTTGTVRVHGYLKTVRGIKLKTSRAFRLGYCDRGSEAGYIIFPVVEDGEIVTYTGRAAGDWEPKYRNPAEVAKGRHVYGIDLVAGCKAPIVVEGPTDVIGMYQKGYTSCAFLGKHATHAQVSKLVERGAEKLVMLLDGDAGEDVYRNARLASELIAVEIATLPGDLDPDDAPKHVVERALLTAREPSVRDFRRFRAASSRRDSRRGRRSRP